MYTLSAVPDKWHSQTSNESYTGTAHGWLPDAGEECSGATTRSIFHKLSTRRSALALNADEADDTPTVSLPAIWLQFVFGSLRFCSVQALPQISSAEVRVPGFGIGALTSRGPLVLTLTVPSPLNIRLAASSHADTSEILTLKALPTTRVNVVDLVAHPAEFSSSSKALRGRGRTSIALLAMNVTSNR